MRTVSPLRRVFLLGMALGILYLFEAPATAAVCSCVRVTVSFVDQQSVREVMQASPDAAEFSFLQSTIRRDTATISISRRAASQAAHPELRAFARQVVRDRESEQDRLLTWLMDRYGDGIDVGRSLAQNRLAVDEIECLGQCGFDANYMLAMIRNCAGAAAIAEATETRSAHGRITDAARRVVTSRSAEIAQLRVWLACWCGIDASVLPLLAC